MHLRKKIIRRGHSMPVPLPIQAFVAAIMKLKARVGIVFRNWEKSNDGNPQIVIKVPFKTNNSFNSTMMASFLPACIKVKPINL